MPSEVDICNGALLHCGLSTITSLEEANDRARACKVFYPSARDALLRMHPWNFAVKRVSLPELSDTPVSGFDHQFQLPSDIIRVLETDDPYREWKIEGGKLLCNDTEVILEYIAKITDVAMFDPLFAEVLEHWLGSKLAAPLRNSETLARSLEEESLRLLREARIANAHEGVMAMVYDDDITRWRRRNVASPLIPWWEGG